MTELRRQPPADRFRNGGFDPDPLHVEEVERARHDGYEQGFRRAQSVGRHRGELVLALLVVFVAGIFVGAWLATEAVLATSETSAVGSHPALAVPSESTPAQPTRPPDGTPRDSGTRVTGQVESPHPAAITDSPLAPIGGIATWYCSSTSPCTAGYRPMDLVAAIDPELGIAKGDQVRVDHEGRTVIVVIVDVCACVGERIVDLTSGAFVHLAPLSAGVIPVSITKLAADVTPPATEADGGNRLGEGGAKGGASRSKSSDSADQSLGGRRSDRHTAANPSRAARLWPTDRGGQPPVD